MWIEPKNSKDVPALIMSWMMVFQEVSDFKVSKESLIKEFEEHGDAFSAEERERVQEFIDNAGEINGIPDGAKQFMMMTMVENVLSTVVYGISNDVVDIPDAIYEISGSFTEHEALMFLMEQLEKIREELEDAFGDMDDDGNKSIVAAIKSLIVDSFKIVKESDMYQELEGANWGIGHTSDFSDDGWIN